MTMIMQRERPETSAQAAFLRTSAFLQLPHLTGATGLRRWDVSLDFRRVTSFCAIDIYCSTGLRCYSMIYTGKMCVCVYTWKNIYNKINN